MVTMQKEFSPDDLRSLIDSTVRTAIKEIIPALSNDGFSKSELLSVKSAASYLGLTLSTVYSKICRREISHVKIGKSVMFEKSHLDAYMHSCTKKRARRKNLRKASHPSIN